MIYTPLGVMRGVGVQILIVKFKKYLFRSLYTKEKDHHSMVFFSYTFGKKLPFSSLFPIKVLIKPTAKAIMPTTSIISIYLNIS